MTRIENEWRYWDCELQMFPPWYTGPALSEIAKWDFTGKRIFEYGVGDSTAWYKKRGANVWGVDSNIEWAKKTGSMFESTEEDYINALNTAAVWGTFDIVVIDGLWRDQCTEKALQHLKPGGYLIIDNYKQKSADLEHWPLTEKLIEGMEVMYFKEPDHQDWVTIVVKK